MIYVPAYIFWYKCQPQKKYYKCFISLKVIELKIVHVLTALIFFSYFYLFKKRKKKENKQA